MDLKSRGQRGRSFVDRAIRSAGFSTPKNTVDHSNVSELEDAQLTKKVEALFAHEPLFERLHTEPKWRKVYNSSVNGAKSTTHFVAKQKLVTKIVVVAVLLGSVSLSVYRSVNHPDHLNSGVTEVAGVVNQTPSATNQSEVPTKAKPSFEVLTPGNTDMEGIERKTPSGEAVYTYSDTQYGARLEVTEQQLPESFRTNSDDKLASIAKNYRMTNVITVDKTKIYYTLSDKSTVQTLVFVKSDRLIFIESSTKLTDDQWAGYYLSLK